MANNQAVISSNISKSPVYVDRVQGLNVTSYDTYKYGSRWMTPLNNVNDNSTLQLYFPSRSGNVDNVAVHKPANFPQFLNYVKYNGGTDVFVSTSNGRKGTFTSSTVASMLKDINAKTGAKISSVTVSGMSLGGPTSVANYRSLLTECYSINEDGSVRSKINESLGPDWPSVRLDLTMYDPDSTGKSSSVKKFEPKELEIMKKTGATVRMICPRSKFNKGVTWKNSNALGQPASNGINTIAYIGNFKHEQSVEVSLETGLQDYIDGKIDIDGVRNTFNGGQEVNWEFCIPDLDENGKIKYKVEKDRFGKKSKKYSWKKYSLTYLQSGLANFFNDDYFRNDDAIENNSDDYYSTIISPRDEFLHTIRYIESTRVKVDFDYLGEIGTLKTDLSNITNSDNISTSYSSSSQALADESKFVIRGCKNIKSICGDIVTDIGIIQDAKEDYSDLERKLNEDVNKIMEDE